MRDASPTTAKRSQWLRRCGVVASGCWLASVGLLWGQHRLGVLHPCSSLFLLLLFVMVVASLCGLALAAKRVVRGPNRRVALAWGFLSLLPLGLWAALAGYVLHLAGSGNSPKNTPADVARMATASVMDLQARYAYPHRLESDRLVMFYDDRVTDPRRDLEAMDRHVARLEAVIGRPLRAKVHWVRGELFGRRQMALYGLALGSSASPANWDTADHPDRLSADRHELAHAVVHQLQPSDCDAPTLLIEGWAEAHAGVAAGKQAEWAKESRALWRGRTGAGAGESYLRELTDPAWYHRIDGPVYSVGGAFASYVLREYGAGRFLGLYFGCRPGRFAEACATHLGVELDALEAAFWADVERLSGNAP